MDNNIQNKLLDYEVPPPDGVWDKIAVGLDGHASPLFAERLYDYEQRPGVSVWEKITESIGGQLPVIPFYRRYRRPLKYSGAAVILIILGIMSSLLISKKTVSEITKESMPVSIGNQTSPGKKTWDTTDEASTIQTASVRQTGLTTPFKRNVRLRPDQEMSSFSLLRSFLPPTAERTAAISYGEPVEKYMVYSDVDGNAVRLPKKLFDAFACPGEDIICKQRIKRLQEKIASAAMNSNFTGILEMLNNLQENQ
jgi:hypothetical protein